MKFEQFWTIKILLLHSSSHKWTYEDVRTRLKHNRSYTQFLIEIRWMGKTLLIRFDLLDIKTKGPVSIWHPVGLYVLFSHSTTTVETHHVESVKESYRVSVIYWTLVDDIPVHSRNTNRRMIYSRIKEKLIFYVVGKWGLNVLTQKL